MKDGIRRKGDRRKEGKKEKKEGDDLHPEKGKREKSGSMPQNAQISPVRHF